MSQTIEIQAPSGLTGATVSLFSLGGNTVIASTAATELSAKQGCYVAVFSGLDIATYQADFFLSDGYALGLANVDVTGADGYFIAIDGLTYNQISAAIGGGGSGSVAVTITVNDGTNPIQGAIVNLLINASQYNQPTNSSGVAVLTPTEGGSSGNPLTYTVQITAGGYQFTPTTLVVSGVTNHTYSMTAISIPTSSTGNVTVYGTCYNQDGTVASGVVHTLTLIQEPSGTGLSVSQLNRSTQSESNGMFSFTNAVIGGVFDVSRSGGQVYRFTAADAGGGVCPVPNLLGN